MTDKDDSQDGFEDDEFDFFDDDDEVGSAQPSQVAQSSAQGGGAALNPDQKKKAMIGAGVLGALLLGIFMYSGGDETEEIIQAAPEIPTIDKAQKMDKKKPSKVATFDEDEIEKAFSSADQGKDKSSKTMAKNDKGAGKPGEEGIFESINDLQDDLFGGKSGQQMADVSQTLELQQSINDVNKRLETNASQIQSLEKTIQQMNQTLNVINQSMGSFDNRIASLSNNVSSLSSDLGKVKRSLTDDDLEATASIAQAGVTQPLMYTAPEYVVHAVIPGRAWLKSTEGQIVTVTEGDSIGNYGRISVIDAANGVVLTSSGTSFR